jgi:histidinol-phosphate aminotransferase
VLEAIASANQDTLRLYPDPNADALRAAIALSQGAHGIEPGQVFVGNGSDEVLATVFQALLKHGRPLLFPDITYSFYPVYCALYGIDYAPVPLDETFQIRPEDYCRPNGGIIFPNPNAPTGRWLTLEQIEALLEANPDSPVVIDEAYVDFGCASAAGLLCKYPNLLVIHTLSKGRSLAGLRVGFALGNVELIDALNRVKNSFNSYPVDRLAMAGACAAMADRDHFDRTRQAVMASRERLVAELTQLGFEVLPSAANFLFVRHPARDGAELAAGLRGRSIIVRHFNQPRIQAFLRITIGTDAQCQVLVRALKEMLG